MSPPIPQVNPGQKPNGKRFRCALCGRKPNGKRFSCTLCGRERPVTDILCVCAEQDNTETSTETETRNKAPDFGQSSSHGQSARTFLPQQSRGVAERPSARTPLSYEELEELLRLWETTESRALTQEEVARRNELYEKRNRAKSPSMPQNLSSAQAEFSPIRQNTTPKAMRAPLTQDRSKPGSASDTVLERDEVLKIAGMPTTKPLQEKISASSNEFMPGMWRWKKVGNSICEQEVIRHGRSEKCGKFHPPEYHVEYDQRIEVLCEMLPMTNGYKPCSKCLQKKKNANHTRALCGTLAWYDHPDDVFILPKEISTEEESVSGDLITFHKGTPHELKAWNHPVPTHLAMEWWPAAKWLLYPKTEENPNGFEYDKHSPFCSRQPPFPDPPFRRGYAAKMIHINECDPYNMPVLAYFEKARHRGLIERCYT